VNYNKRRKKKKGERLRETTGVNTNRRIVGAMRRDRVIEDREERVIWAKQRTETPKRINRRKLAEI